MSRRKSIENIDEWLDGYTDVEIVKYDQKYLDEKISAMFKPLCEQLENFCKESVGICARIGLPPKLMDERINDISEVSIGCHESTLKYQQEDFDKMCQYKRDLLQKVEKMTADLYLPPYVPEENITLLQNCKKLKADYNKLNVVREKRLSRWNELRDRQTQLCIVLGIRTPEQVKTQTDIPTEEELAKFTTVIVDLEKEERRRKEKFEVLKDTITKCLGLLEIQDQSFNELIRKPDYSESTMRKLTDMHSTLEAQYAANQLKYDRLRQRLESLYDRLDINGPERDLFMEVHSACKPSLMAEMELKVVEYEELKKQNIGKFIEKIHQELVVEYERCYFEQEQQDAFFSVATEPSEELLALYENELERLRKYFDDNRDILERFQKWRFMWKELIELEIKANDPNRFNNRGGQLLAEEKKRKNLQRNLPKIEKDLVDLNSKYLANTGSKFKVFGTPLDEFITGCWDELHHAKEVEKRERQKAKMTPSKGPVTRPGMAAGRGTPMKRPIAASGSRLLGALSLSEQEFEAMAVARPTSAKRPGSRLGKQ